MKATLFNAIEIKIQEKRALKTNLKLIMPLMTSKNGQLISVYGCRVALDP